LRLWHSSKLDRVTNPFRAGNLKDVARQTHDALMGRDLGAFDDGPMISVRVLSLERATAHQQRSLA
jgi:hypothetical protein